MNKYIAILLLIGSVLSFGSPVFADLQKGLDAAERGDFATAFIEWKSSADQGDADAQNNLGYMHLNRLGAAQDDKEAEKKRLNEIIPVSSGSGFAVSAAGHVVTNNHVIDGCTYVSIHHKGKVTQATVIYRDELNDLAVLKGDFVPSAVFKISRRNPEIMQEIFVAGYPFGNQISSSIKVTKGIISSLSGIGNNISNIQIDAALQPGNSGGPIFDEKGNLVGVAVAKLDLKQVVENWGVVPEGTNFGIKSNVVVNLLESNGIKIQEARNASLSNAELGKVISGATYHLSCWMTMAQAKTVFSTDSGEVSGIYRSEITSNTSYIFKNKKHRNLIITLKQEGSSIIGADKTTGSELTGTREGDIIEFEFWSKQIYVGGGKSGEWKVIDGGNRLEGFWGSVGTGSPGGKWNLTRIE